MTVEWHFPLRTFFGTHCVMNDRHIFAYFCTFMQFAFIHCGILESGVFWNTWMNCAFAHLDVLICVHHSNILRWGALWTICWGNTLSTWTLFQSNGFPMSQISNFWTFELLTANMWTKNHIFFTLHTIPESEQAHYYMEDRDINIPESIFESPLLQIALENVPCPRCATFFSEAFSGWKIFTSSKKSFTPTKSSRAVSKKRDYTMDPAFLIKYHTEVEALKHSMSISKWHFIPTSFGKNWLSSGCSCPAPTLPSAPSPPPPEKETGQEGKEKTHLQLDQVSKIEWQVGYIFHILGNNSICRLVLKASTLFLQIDFSRIILLWLGKISPFT